MSVHVHIVSGLCNAYRAALVFSNIFRNFPKQPVQSGSRLLCNQCSSSCVLSSIIFASICQTVKTADTASQPSARTHSYRACGGGTDADRWASCSFCSRCFEAEASGHKMYTTQKSQLVNQNCFIRIKMNWIKRLFGAYRKLWMYSRVSKLVTGHTKPVCVLSGWLSWCVYCLWIMYLSKCVLFVF